MLGEPAVCTLSPHTVSAPRKRSRSFHTPDTDRYFSYFACFTRVSGLPLTTSFIQIPNPGILFVSLVPWLLQNKHYQPPEQPKDQKIWPSFKCHMNHTSRQKESRRRPDLRRCRLHTPFQRATDSFVEVERVLNENERMSRDQMNSDGPDFDSEPDAGAVLGSEWTADPILGMTAKQINIKKEVEKYILEQPGKVTSGS
ncbi:hypothetical protein EVAR_9391_1 [Eumeta japonica]|uniref:Uncharacterized protein n=1 Tax=Eumeta variegata TaxID=151549 RepID=A0A4C1UCS1_EUMVA|nr:hypothetical protein EVAR_9391_1 [Eumeta japonica]